MLPGYLEVCVPTEEESLVFAGLTCAVLITAVRNQDRSNWFEHTGLRRLSSTCISSIMRLDATVHPVLLVSKLVPKK